MAISKGGQKRKNDYYKYVSQSQIKIKDQILTKINKTIL